MTRSHKKGPWKVNDYLRENAKEIDLKAIAILIDQRWRYDIVRNYLSDPKKLQRFYLDHLRSELGYETSQKMLVQGDRISPSRHQWERPELSKTDWRDVQHRLFEMYDRGDTWLGYDELKHRLTCSRATIQKAIKPPQSALRALSDSDRKDAVEVGRKLAGWRARHTNAKGSLRASSLTEVVMDDVEQRREPDPAEVAEADDVDIVFARLIQEANPDERGKLNVMTTDQRRKIVDLLKNDPDKYNRILGRKP